MTRQDKATWKQLHAGWLKKVPAARHILTNQSGHYIQREQPELVIDAIRERLNELSANNA
jgi:pimeloyl-ACP methyl ester carboxylesterase